MYRPIIIINFAGMDFTDTEKYNFLDALTFVLLTVKKYMMLPKYIEKWIVLIDLANISAFSFNKHLATSVFDYLGQHFINDADRIYVYNPSQSFLFLWKAIQSRLG